MTKEKEFLKDETLAEKLVKRWFWLYIFAFLIAPSGYIIKLLISNDLSVEEVWIIYSIIWFISILSNYNDLWFTESLKYFLPKFWLEKKYNNFKTSLFMALWIQTFTAIIIAIWLWFGADFLAQNYFHSVYAWTILKVFSLFFIIYNIFRTFDIIFFSFQDTFANKFVEFVRMWSIVIFVAILFFSHKWNLFNYSIAWFVWTLIWLLIALVIFLKKYRNILSKWEINLNKSLSKKIFSYSIWVVVATQWALILGSIDLQMIVYFLWSKQAWYYTNYLSMFNIYSILLGPILLFLFPITTELITKKQNWKLSLMINIFYKYFVVFGWIIWLFFAIFWTFIAFILFWEKFIPSWNLLTYSAWFIFLSILVNINFNILAWLGKIKERVKIIWIAALLNFILNWFLIQKVWIVWAVFSTILSIIIMFILSFIELKKTDIKFNFDWLFYIKNLLILIILGFIFFYIKSWWLFGNRLEILWKMFIVFFMYVLVMLGVNWKEVKILIEQMKGLR